MVVTTAEAPRLGRGGLRPMDPTQDLKAIATLIADAFADEIDERGKAALREMRWMARLSPLVWWWSQADPSFRDAFNGFVWEEPSSRGKGPFPRGQGWQIVGNASLSRAPGSTRHRVICNVVVQPGYQGQGIGQRLIDAAISEAQEMGPVQCAGTGPVQCAGTGGVGVVLQVHQDNLRALRLYTERGFQEVAGETDLRLETVRSVALLDAPGYRIRTWHPSDGQTGYELAQMVTPTALQWLRPVRPSDYRTSWWNRLGRRLVDLMAGRRLYRLTVLKDERLVAMMTVLAAFRRGDHHLVLSVHPDHRGQIEVALVSRALHMLAAIPLRPVRITVHTEHTAALKVLGNYGFEEQRTLLTLRRNF